MNKFLSFVFTLFLVGCASIPSVLPKRAAFDLNCPEGELKSQKFTDTQFGFEGCGKRAVYNCGAPAIKGGEPECKKDGETTKIK